jgi:hypothetical protein
MASCIGAGLFCVGLCIAGWLTYLEWWVHPDYTRAQMFWAYPWETIAMIVLFVAGVNLFTRGRK